MNILLAVFSIIAFWRGLWGIMEYAEMNKIYGMSVQWHITDRCTNRCRHCYMFDEKTCSNEIEKELDIKGMFSILDSISEFEEKWKATVQNFTITGGDPLMHPDWILLLKELKARNKNISIMGNPESLTDKNLSILEEMGVRSFQMSLDGLEERHDYFRSPGSFQRTLEGIKKLKSTPIKTSIMFTLFPENKDQLIPLLNFAVTELGVHSFAFDLGAYCGNASTLEKGHRKEDIKMIFSSYLSEKERLKKEGYSTRVYAKNNLFKLLKFEKGGFYPSNVQEVSVISGCLTGWTCVPVLSDGSVLACRRFPLKAGKMPEQSFEDIFLSSEIYKKFRRSAYFAGCGECGFYQHCRGCPAVVSSLTGDPFSHNPLCFRDSIKRELPSNKIISLPLDSTREEEYNLVAGHFLNMFYNKMNEFINHETARNTLLEILQEDKLKSLYLKDLEGYLKSKNLSDFQKLFIKHFLHTIRPDTDEYDLIYNRLFRANF
jgi:radical SAM protein with 4Fe4S-binding SPASM domain